VILCEGYTDVLALHQAGLPNAVGLMGTALTGEQVGELARMAQTVLLALDADSAGQEAMLRAAGLAARRKLELRVVPLPAGADPAELVQRGGVEAINAAVGDSVPFVRFRVERVLAGGDDSTPEGRDRMVEELRPVFATLPPSAMRMELTRIVSGRLALPESLAEAMLANGTRRGGRPGWDRAPEGRDPTPTSDRPPGPPARRREGLLRRGDTERAFLALCIASPDEGAGALESLQVDEHFTSDLLRRAARHLGEGSLREPMTDAPGPAGSLDGDPELKALLAELIVEAGRERSHPAMLEAQRMQLELARVERQIRQARGQGGGDVSELAMRRDGIKHEFEHAYMRALEETGG
jgi:DNA primase